MKLVQRSLSYDTSIKGQTITHSFLYFALATQFKWQKGTILIYD